ncbi:Xaa-Pro aminopeptidase 1 [Orchesella cincta]|uniref:Xaa-Pro aminopeptidase 1 n=1 Tax=Orchesella cincta TaxID=48709 RepID=A0A1D2NMK8_ORCCI|nr:Xaa-Pro aminopeptidase 1 [Orchesella cincta]
MHLYTVLSAYSGKRFLQTLVHKMAAKDTTVLLQQLRQLMGNLELVQEPLAAYIVPSPDAHNSEYIADCDTRRAFITGFDGSAGTAIVTLSKALMWTDGRYFLQASQQMDSNWTLMKMGLADVPPPSEWLNKNLPAGSFVGVDPRLYCNDEWDKLAKALHENGNRLVAVKENLVDLIWQTRPSRPKKHVDELPLKYAGKSTADKLVDLRKKIADDGVEYLVVTELDQIAWLLNWRGSDIQFNPVFFSYVIVGQTDLEIFIDPEKVGSNIHNSILEQDKNVRFHQYDDIGKVLEKLVSTTTGKIMVAKTCNYYLASMIPESRRVTKVAPIALMKTIKNSVEVDGMKNCHIRDAVAVCCFFGWLENALKAGEVVTEVSAATKLEEFRKKQANFIGLSFETISGSGPNGAIVHYNPNTATESRRLALGDVYLVDSGGQYLDGTTDITRTVIFGKPTEFQKECYTRVLKGQIQLVTSIFPDKLVGNYLDSFARKALWEVGLDYAHGTGHGVGSYLNVHEGPSGISWRPYPDDPGMQENMFMSNEPGYYHEGEFGIRLENIIRVVKALPAFNVGTRGYLTFEDITFVPIQQRMIEVKLLSPVEIEYLNYFHTKCRKVVGSYMESIGIPPSDPGYQWLIKETEHLSLKM